jgi:hypothetical protein
LLNGNTAMGAAFRRKMSQELMARCATGATSAPGEGRREGRPNPAFSVIIFFRHRENPMARQQDDRSTDEDSFGRQDVRRPSTWSSVVVIVAAAVVLALVYYFFSSDLP